MHKYIYCFLLCSAMFATQAQFTNVDSLRQLVKQETRDTFYIAACTRLATAYFIGAIELDSAMVYAQRAFVMASALQQEKWRAISAGLIGNIYYTRGIYARSLEAMLISLKANEKTKDERRIGLMLNNLGNVYAAMGDYTTSNEYVFRANAIAEKNNDRVSMASCAVNASDSYCKLGKYDSALYYANKGYAIASQDNNTEAAGVAMTNLGNVYSATGEGEIALGCYRKAVQLFYGNSLLADPLLGMAKVFQKLGAADSSLHYARSSFEYASPRGMTLEILNAATFMADHYKKQGVVDSAYRYLNYVLAAKDSLFNEEKSRQIQSMFYEETARQQKIEQTRMEAAEERSHNIQYAVMAVGVVCFLVLILLLSRSVIVNEKWISFLGVLGLLLLFEFINLFIHPFLGDITHHSPFLMFLALVVIAAILIPLHHRVEHAILHRLTLKNRKIRLEAAKRTVAELEKKEEES